MFAVDRAGIVGADGATHQGAFDLSFLRCIPNMIIMAPSDERECQLMLTTGHKLTQPSVVRYPRGSGTGETLPDINETIEIGKGVLKNTSTANENRIVILNFGTILSEAEKVAQTLNTTLVDMRFVKPLDTVLIDELVQNHQTIVTVEDNVIAGGAGSGVNEYILSNGLNCKVLNIGLPDQFIKHGSQNEVHHDLGLDSEGIVRKITNFLDR